MVIIAVLLPAAFLALVMALDWYEERFLAPR